MRPANFLYFAYGDDAGQALADDRELETALGQAPPSLRWKARAYPGETHSSLPLVAQIDALRSLYEGYRYHNDWLGRGAAAADAHYAALSTRLRWPVPTPEHVLNSLGHEALRKNRKAEAIRLFERSTSTNPGSAAAYDGLAEAYAKAGRRSDASKAAATAARIASDPGHPNHPYYRENAKKTCCRGRELTASSMPHNRLFSSSCNSSGRNAR